jgi:hypothetical protein
VSEEVRLIVFITPGGMREAFNKVNLPAERMQVPAGVDILTYAPADLTKRSGGGA